VLTAVELEKQLNLAVQRLREALSPIAIYFFGSYAYGTPAPHSDIDLLVIVEDSPLDACDFAVPR
jgi:predicted nucleotidyltransferase